MYAHFMTILDLFWCKKLSFGPIYNIKLKFWSYLTSKVDETKHTSTVFCCKKYENIFGVHVGTILDSFWCHNWYFEPGIRDTNVRVLRPRPRLGKPWSQGRDWDWDFFYASLNVKTETFFVSWGIFAIPDLNESLLGK